MRSLGVVSVVVRVGGAGLVVIRRTWGGVFVRAAQVLNLTEAEAELGRDLLTTGIGIHDVVHALHITAARAA